MSEDRFFERLRNDARQLRYEGDDVMMSRLAARIRGRIAEPTVVEILARWFRPVAASLAALAVAASVGLTLLETNDAISLDGDQVEIAMAGDVYGVGD